MSGLSTGQWIREEKEGVISRLFVVGRMYDGRLVVQINPACDLRLVDERRESRFWTILPDCEGWHWIEPTQKYIDVSPGDGYRWLEPDEPVIEGDEWFCVYQGKWNKSYNWSLKEGQGKGLCYRRKVNPVRFWCRGGAHQTHAVREILVSAENPGGCCEVKSDGDGGWIIEEDTNAG